ncbi:formylglycine-generating enzyme family protein [Candidatus Poribacteria bacterium]
MARRWVLALIIVATVLVVAIAYGDDVKEQIDKAWKSLPKQITGEDGAPMILMPAGDFQMGSNDGAGDEKPAHKVYTDAFYMDIYEVTNAQYARFLTKYQGDWDSQGAVKTPDWDGSTRRYALVSVGGNIKKIGETYIPKAGYENHPVTYVSWYGALAYAEHYGKRLPTEAEWEKAARDGLIGKKYPWGDMPPDGTQCNFADKSASGGWHSEWSDKEAYDGYPLTAPVGSYTPNGYGLHDMAGNVWEWCADWYGYYPDLYEKNPAGPDSGADRVLRGGAWNNTPSYLRAAYRYSRRPTKTLNYIGFRCVKDAMP